MQIINATPHEITLFYSGAKVVFPKGDIVPRLDQKEEVRSILIAGVEFPIHSQNLQLSGLPPQVDGVIYLVSPPILEAGKRQGRTDLLAPITIQNKNGYVFGCNGFNE